jgi:uncharacterized membrane protein YciS (DUF1049 family)
MVTVIFLASLNTQTYIDVAFWSEKGILTIAHHVSLVQITLFAFVAGLLVGILWAGAFYLQVQKKLKEYLNANDNSIETSTLQEK